jgi:hypothetical protein
MSGLKTRQFKSEQMGNRVEHSNTCTDCSLIARVPAARRWDIVPLKPPANTGYGVGVVRMRQLRTVSYKENRCWSCQHAPAKGQFPGKKTDVGFVRMRLFRTVS